MARVTDFLYRFRPAGSPGAASPAGVPVDRSADIAAELEPLFRQLADAEAACDALVEQARAEASARLAHDTRSAHDIVVKAQEQVAAERAAAAVTAQGAGQPELGTIRARAQAEAEDLGRRASGRIPAHVARVVVSVRAMSDPSSVRHPDTA